MSKEEAARGLLSKVVRFVRNPTVQWSELEAPEEDKEGQYSKQMLKEMIERKRRNDFVRRREFEQLRKLRRKEVVQGQKLEDATGRTSFAQSTMLSQTSSTNASPDGRAVTLKKIDEIEAQMSQQWWRAKPGGASGDRPVPRVIPPPLQDPQVTAEVPLEFAATAPLTMPPSGFAATQPATMPGAMSGAIPGGIAPTVPMTLNGMSMDFDVPTLGLDAVVAHEELEKFVHEPDLEEAAIRFANGDYAGAESGLLEVLTRHAQDDPKDQIDIWMTLFDLYRATGQQERFDKLAIDYAGRFSRSAPLWFSLPEQLGLAATESAGAAVNSREFSWNAPPTLTTQSLAALQASIGRKPAPPWTFNWSRTTDIDPQALPGLGDMFLQWADEPVDLKFVGVPALNAMLQSKTQSGDRTADEQWWRLRMALLRLMGLPDEFELVALDYCVTYEVSPPSWAPTKCKFQGDDSALNAVVEQARLDAVREHDMLNPSQGAARAVKPEASKLQGLSGCIDGDAVPLLESFEALAKPDAPLQIPCDRLIRMDFPAAGSVLNWAAEQQAKGRAVQFINLHRLIAVFFNVIGIGEHAWVVPRRN
ncbi:STAS domain-containing protein [Diaphorobacter sp. HDW4A]|uniref:STAS domain-containing protein n=1 Tax=Diaphorobacter sp. HDW4A TaxID=2714924 RepID=UPI00140AF2B9|nr:STAS domain-containing protein [Diaphorobacter sp. HDW4A]QIL83336.1 STAS domain-containing protein [Diaphorobacter sp. HDW4A]